jgi:hypothetical protein
MKKLIAIVFFISQCICYSPAQENILKSLQKKVFDLYSLKYEILMSYDFKPRDILLAKYASFYHASIASQKVADLRKFAAIDLKNLKKAHLQRYTLQVLIREETIISDDNGIDFEAEITYDFMTNEIDHQTRSYKKINGTEMVHFHLNNAQELLIVKDSDSYIYNTEKIVEGK